VGTRPWLVSRLLKSSASALHQRAFLLSRAHVPPLARARARASCSLHDLTRTLRRQERHILLLVFWRRSRDSESRRNVGSATATWLSKSSYEIYLWNYIYKACKMSDVVFKLIILSRSETRSLFFARDAKVDPWIDPLDSLSSQAWTALRNLWRGGDFRLILNSMENRNTCYFASETLTETLEKKL